MATERANIKKKKNCYVTGEIQARPTTAECFTVKNCHKPIVN